MWTAVRTLAGGKPSSRGPDRTRCHLQGGSVANGRGGQTVSDGRFQPDAAPSVSADLNNQ